MFTLLHTAHLSLQLTYSHQISPVLHQLTRASWGKTTYPTAKRPFMSLENSRNLISLAREIKCLEFSRDIKRTLQQLNKLLLHSPTQICQRAENLDF